ncbi:MAG: transposase [Candidatus Aminicenantes bacterium]|nr:transposase [Candidatus Aminicenantes bacterium]
MNQEKAEVATIGKEFYSPMFRALEKTRWRRECPEFTDDHFLKVGIGRCLNDVRSGRDWIQKAIAILKLSVTVSRFFTSLKSHRRLGLLGNIATLVRSEADENAPNSDDPFSKHSELDGFAIYAADGHFHGCSAHEEAIGGKRHPVGHFFGMNLRTQTMNHLDVGRPKNKREHDITALKRLEGNVLRMGEVNGRKVILAYDPAIYEFAQWKRWKQSKGIYVITRMKDKIRLLICDERVFDREDPRNVGIVSDQLGETNSGDILRKIVYVEPATGRTFVFLTNEMTLPPGLIAFIYKKRWDIEKVFDQFKNKLMENRAWAKSPNAKCAQAKFMALTHNLTLLLERKIELEEGISDTKIEKKRKQRIEADRKTIQKAGRKENPLVTQPYKAVQRSFQFIRWLRNSLLVETSWRQAIIDLRPLMVAYLS